MDKSIDVVVTIAAKDKAAYTRARNSMLKAGGSFRELIGKIAKDYFDGPLTVAQFAKAMGEELGMGKGITEEEKKERATIRSRIHDGLKAADMLKVNAKASKAQRKPRTPKGAGDAAEKAEQVKDAIEKAAETATKQSDIFAAFNGLLTKASKATLERMANALAVKLAEQAKAKQA